MEVLKTVNITGLGEKHQGKVRDFWVVGYKRILVATDRQSAFDQPVGFVPYKGAVLNLVSEYWFNRTRHIVANHLLAVPDPNVSIVANCKPINVEMVVRGYISGETSTSIWPSYRDGERTIYGVELPNGLRKNQKLPRAIITPTTHETVTGGHDQRLTKEKIIKQRIVAKDLYEQMEKASLALFDFGSRLSRRHGLILVDTKYEFGLYGEQLMLIDEVHTPDSSRFWKANTYLPRFKKGEEPENFDKELLRLWLKKNGDQKVPQEIMLTLSANYIAVCEMTRGKPFVKAPYPIEARIKQNVQEYLQTVRS